MLLFFFLRVGVCGRSTARRTPSRFCSKYSSVVFVLLSFFVGGSSALVCEDSVGTLPLLRNFFSAFGLLTTTSGSTSGARGCLCPGQKTAWSSIRNQLLGAQECPCRRSRLRAVRHPTTESLPEGSSCRRTGVVRVAKFALVLAPAQLPSPPLRQPCSKPLAARQS